MGNCGVEQTYSDFSKVTDIKSLIQNYLVQNNDSIFEVLKYDTPDAVGRGITLAEKIELLQTRTGKGFDDNTRLFLFSKIPDAETQTATEIHIHTGAIEARRGQQVVSDATIVIDIFAHVDNNWLTSVNDSRSEFLMATILRTLNGQNIGGLGEIRFIPGDKVMYRDWNTKFVGYRITMTQFVA